jgi:nitrogen fixation/metabolism regulation signal transduction histidine kinase
MKFNRFNLLVIARVLVLMANFITIAFLTQQTQLSYTIGLLIVLSIIQIADLLWYINSAQRDLAKFLFAIKYEDYSVNFVDKKLNRQFSNLSQAFQDIIEKLRFARIEKESQLQLFKTLLEKLAIGVLVYDTETETIAIMNNSASKLLNMPNPKYWSRLKKREPEFTDVVESLEFGGRKLASIEEQGMKKELSVDVSFVKITNSRYNVIAFQDIRDEIEQKEIEAWHKLIRILTHEIMNSITPVSSLSETMLSMLKQDKEPIPASSLDDDTVEDLILAVNTINKRSNGMLEFVNDYRKLTRIPAPNFELISANDLFNDILNLNKAELDKRGIKAGIKSNSQHIYIRCDQKLIEQIIINLFSNSFHALKNTENPEIHLFAEATDKRIFLHFSDNGAGIEKEKQERIFIPFYTTKQRGSGIGLSLSKNIMQMHQGTISVSSERDVETTFTLNFPNHAYNEK